MISGSFIALAAIRYGVQAFRKQLVITQAGGMQVGRWYEWCISYVVPIQFVAMFSWWMYQSVVVYEPDEWWNPLQVLSVATCVVQWGVVLIALRILNRRLLSRDSSGRATLRV